MITATAWIATVAVVVGLLALDLYVGRNRTDEVSLREATIWSLAYVAIALAFGVVVLLLGGGELGQEYFAGYVIEKSLSVDNLFVFVAIFGTFAIPAPERPRLLAGGISAALILRAGFIVAGAALLHAFQFSFAIFGAILIVAAIHLIRHRHQEPHPERNPIVRRLMARGLSPTRLALLTMIGADLLFALDSIPAIYGVTDHPYIVFAANAFALLGLRALFFLVTGLVKRLVHLPLGMSAILAFIGLKLILHAAHSYVHGVPTIGTSASLLIILAILAITVIASLWQTRTPRGGRRSVSCEPAQASAGR